MNNPPEHEVIIVSSEDEETWSDSTDGEPMFSSDAEPEMTIEQESTSYATSRYATRDLMS